MVTENTTESHQCNTLIRMQCTRTQIGRLFSMDPSQGCNCLYQCFHVYAKQNTNTQAAVPHHMRLLLQACQHGCSSPTDPAAAAGAVQGLNMNTDGNMASSPQLLKPHIIPSKQPFS